MVPILGCWAASSAEKEMALLIGIDEVEATDSCWSYNLVEMEL